MSSAETNAVLARKLRTLAEAGECGKLSLAPTGCAILRDAAEALARPASDTGVEGARTPVPAMKAVAEWNGLFDELPPGISDDTEAWMERCDAGDYSTEQLVAHVILDERSRRATLSHPPHGAEPVGPQCCMCGKKGLSTVEGDGGTECELGDGRWVCSAECYDRAVPMPEDLAPSASREGGLDEAARLVEGEPDNESYRTWPWWNGGNASNDGDLVQHCDELAKRIRALAKQGGAS